MSTLLTAELRSVQGFLEVIKASKTINVEEQMMAQATSFSDKLQRQRVSIEDATALLGILGAFGWSDAARSHIEEGIATSATLNHAAHKPPSLTMKSLQTLTCLCKSWPNAAVRVIF